MEPEKTKTWDWLISLQCQINDLKEQVEDLTDKEPPDPYPQSESDYWRLFRSGFGLGRPSRMPASCIGGFCPTR
jgi:hypothetical protein